jgi:hypothetical protein
LFYMWPQSRSNSSHDFQAPLVVDVGIFFYTLAELVLPFQYLLENSYYGEKIPGWGRTLKAWVVQKN